MKISLINKKFIKKSEKIMKCYSRKKTIKIITIILKIYNITKLYFKKRLDSFQMYVSLRKL